jgi:hypothetical protein
VVNDLFNTLGTLTFFLGISWAPARMGTKATETVTDLCTTTEAAVLLDSVVLKFRTEVVLDYLAIVK